MRRALAPRWQVFFGVALFGNLACAQIITVPPPKPRPPVPAYEQPQWSLVLGAGWSRRTAPLPEGLSNDQRDFIEAQRNGAQASLGVEHYRTATFGFGLSVEGVQWSHSAASLTLEDTGLVTARAAASSTVRLLSVGPRMFWRPVDPRGRVAFTLEVGGGYVNYRDAFTFGADSSRIIGHSVFGNGALLLDVKATDRITIGARLAYVLASFNRFEVEYENGIIGALPSGYTENARHIDLGLRVGFALGRGQAPD